MMAKKFGFTDPCPTQGLVKQLQVTLAALPIDLTPHANELAEFMSKSGNPLTQKNPKQAKQLETLRLKEKEKEAAAGQAVLPVGGATGPVDAPQKLKDLFVLAQKGDFEILSKFAATKCGGPDAVAETMRKKIVQRIKEGFRLGDADCQKGVELFIPAVHQIPKDTKLQTSKPTSAMPAPDARDGPALSAGKRVSVVETLENAGSPTYVRIARPKHGWIPLDELQPLSSINAASQSDAALTNVSSFLRAVRNYSIRDIQDVSEELDMGIDFITLGKQRIVDAILQSSKDYQAGVVIRAAKPKAPDEIGACLDALDRKDIGFVRECLKLPPPAAPKPPAPKEKSAEKKKPQPKKEIPKVDEESRAKSKESEAPAVEPVQEAVQVSHAEVPGMVQDP
jgi:hypothetical protein